MSAIHAYIYFLLLNIYFSTAKICIVFIFFFLTDRSWLKSFCIYDFFHCFKDCNDTFLYPSLWSLNSEIRAGREVNIAKAVLKTVLYCYNFDENCNQAFLKIKSLTNHLFPLNEGKSIEIIEMTLVKLKKHMTQCSWYNYTKFLIYC